MDLYFFTTETLDADSRNLPESSAVLVHLMLCIRAMPICASVLRACDNDNDAANKSRSIMLRGRMHQERRRSSRW